MELIFELIFEFVAYIIGLNVRYFVLKPFYPKLQRASLFDTTDKKHKKLQFRQDFYNLMVGLAVLAVIFVGVYMIWSMSRSSTLI